LISDFGTVSNRRTVNCQGGSLTHVGTAAHPLRVAVIGSGPAGFFLAQHLLARAGVVATVDMFERLPTPFGLVRFGVAPDHEEIKRVSRQFEKTASKPAFRFFGNVDYGRHVTLDDLRRYYHQICFTTGAQTDRRLGIPGEDLEGSHAATEFVAWYNGHPEYRDRRFDLTAERVAVIGVGNVAVDVARILCRTPEELATTDIADYALEALRHSGVREVIMVGRVERAGGAGWRGRGGARRRNRARSVQWGGGGAGRGSADLGAQAGNPPRVRDPARQRQAPPSHAPVPGVTGRAQE
jgi:NADPH-dependent glutamate synthase beta subunit-like oxidoreductase